MDSCWQPFWLSGPVALNTVNISTSEVVYSTQGAGEYALSNREIIGFGGTARYDSTLNGKVLDLAMREAINKMVDEAFRQNGMTTPSDIHELTTSKLQEIFGADAGLYVTVSDYGTRYMVLSSATIVTASAKLVDLRTGTTLWTGSATASSEEGRQNQGGLIGMLVMAAVNQVISSVQDDAGYPIASMTSARLLSPYPNGGILYGPRSPTYGTG